MNTATKPQPATTEKPESHALLAVLADRKDGTGSIVLADPVYRWDRPDLRVELRVQPGAWVIRTENTRPGSWGVRPASLILVRDESEGDIDWETTELVGKVCVDTGTVQVSASGSPIEVSVPSGLGDGIYEALAWRGSDGEFACIEVVFLGEDWL